MILDYRRSILAWDPIWVCLLESVLAQDKISAGRLRVLMLQNSKIKWNTHVLGVYLIWFWGKGLCLSSLDQDEKL